MATVWQPWKERVNVHSRKSIIALTLFIVLLAPVVAQARAYQTFTVDVPFEFTIGDRKFKPGTYIFVILGPGLMTVENAKKRVITTLMTRDIRAADATVSPRMYFDKKNGHNHLASIWMGNGAAGLEIIGEEVAMRQTQPPPPFILLPRDSLSLVPRELQDR
jgi:hypothetical protein